ncbi:MAG: phosphoadenylyl-sulfate reductase [Planctomyces sp.]|nr:phosphoadenylyl-sulfate reductase [Planctomyces sp.]
MAKLSQADLTELNRTFEERSPTELLHWATEMFGPRAAAISAMQMAGSVLCHMISAQKLALPVLFVDTGVNFQETLETRDRIATEYGVEIRTLKPDLSMDEQTKQLGVLYLTPDGQERCCHLRKTLPLAKTRGQYDCLVSSLRRAEGGKRDNVPILSVDPPMNSLRLNPLANLQDDQMDAYIATHRVIINPLHYQGYSTISCNRCTTPVLPNEPKRAGRWRHLGPWAMYCGINATDVDGGISPSIDLGQEVVDRILGRSTDFAI